MNKNVKYAKSILKNLNKEAPWVQTISQNMDDLLKTSTFWLSKDGSMRGVNWKQYLNEWELAYKVSHGMTTSTEVSTLPFEFFPDDEEEDVA